MVGSIVSKLGPTNRDASFLSLAMRADVFCRAFCVAMIVGPVLGAINHGDKIVIGTMEVVDWLKFTLTFLVPFSVSTWSSVMALRDQAREL